MVKKKDKFIGDGEPPVKKAGKGGGFKKFIWNKEKKQFCGRSGVSWWSKRKLLPHSDYWAKKILDFTDHIGHGNNTGVYDCEKTGMHSSKKVVCKIDLTQMGPCNKSMSFGFDEGQPCIAIKLNKIFGWKPKPLDPNKDVKIIGKMPLELKYMIYEPASQELISKYVWISCEGSSASDKENLGPIVYYPFPGIHVRYFPYLNQPNYQQPFVFVQFPHLHPGIMVNVECKAWAKNIISDKEKSGGRPVGAHFKLLMD